MGSEGQPPSLSEERMAALLRRISGVVVEHDKRTVSPMRHSVFALQIATELDNLSTAEARLARDLVFAVRHPTTSKD